MKREPDDREIVDYIYAEHANAGQTTENSDRSIVKDD